MRAQRSSEWSSCFRLRQPLLVIVLLLSYGCYTSYNLAAQREEISFTSTEREIRMGEKIAQQVVKELEPVADTMMQARVRAIGKQLAAYSSRQELTYHFEVVEGEEINAFTIPGGHIFVNEALVRFAKSDDELASVLAHEIGHTAARHPVRRYEKMLLGSLGQTLAAVVGRDADLTRGSQAVMLFVFLAHARQDELLADQLAVGYVQAAGYDPEAMVTFMQRLKRREQSRPRPRSYFRTHPYMADRISIVHEAATGGMGYTDYLNRTE